MSKKYCSSGLNKNTRQGQTKKRCTLPFMICQAKCILSVCLKGPHLQYMSIYIHTDIYICVCIHTKQTPILTYIQTYIHKYVHTYIHAYVHTYMHAYIHSYTTLHDTALHCATLHYTYTTLHCVSCYFMSFNKVHYIQDIPWPYTDIRTSIRTIHSDNILCFSKRSRALH